MTQTFVAKIECGKEMGVAGAQEGPIRLALDTEARNTPPSDDLKAPLSESSRAGRVRKSRALSPQEIWPAGRRCENAGNP